MDLLLICLPTSIEPDILTDPYSLLTKEKITRRIESGGQSAAAVLCCVGKEFPPHEPRTDFIEDIVGLVALIGKAWTIKLSRMLAEYLGEDEMLALVCRSFRAACALEEYEQNGEANCTLGLHGKATERGKSIVGRFLVICLEDMSVHVAEDRISIFYTGPGMDSSEENSIVKWGKMGANLHT